MQKVFNKEGLASRWAVYKPLLTKQHKKRRMQFARKFKAWRAAQWQKVVFSDEKIFRVRPGGNVRRWILKDARRFEARCLHQPVT